MSGAPIWAKSRTPPRNEIRWMEDSELLAVLSEAFLIAEEHNL